jgi:CheY-like chemotaxis protein
MSNQPRRILFLEDDHESLIPVCELLETIHGFEVDLSASHEVLDWLRQKQYDLLCVDLMISPKSVNEGDEVLDNLHFPGVHWQTTGLEFLRRLRRGELTDAQVPGTAAQVPVIVLSAVADDSAEIGGPLDEERTRYIEKPFDVGELMSTITQMIEQTEL